MTPAEILDRAAALLERVGWCQHINRNHVGEHCIWGAVGGVAVLTDELDEPGELLDALLDGGIVAWNDAPGRTFAEVHEALLAAASLAMDGEASS